MGPVPNITIRYSGREYRRAVMFLASTLAAVTCTFVAPPAVGHAGTATVVVTNPGGPLEFVTVPTSVTFPPVPAGTDDREVHAAPSFEINDARGTGEGWNVQVTGVAVMNGTHRLPLGAVSEHGAPVVSCDLPNSCYPPEDTDAVSTPWVLSDTPQKLISAGPESGMGTSRTVPTFSLRVPRGASAGSYTATWTVSLATGP